MNYSEANKLLVGRCSQSKRLANNTYLKRRTQGTGDPDAYAVLLHETDILTFFSDGSIEVNTGGYHTRTTYDRMNQYLPSDYSVHGEPMSSRRNSDGMTVLSCGSWRNPKGPEVTCDPDATINPDGSIVGGNVQEYRDARREERNAEKRPINRANYWLRKSRGIQVIRTGCQYANKGRWERRHCETLSRAFRRARRLAIGKYTCGCEVIRKEHKYRDLSVQSILAENNTTIRTAKMMCYGMERFFLDANPETVATLKDYALLRLVIRADRWNGESLVGLKMTCPSTGAVYLNMVPPNITSVSAALDWMFNTTDYLGQLTQET